MSKKWDPINNWIKLVRRAERFAKKPSWKRGWRLFKQLVKFIAIVLFKK